jgi:hypothetical protein
MKSSIFLLALTFISATSCFAMGRSRPGLEPEQTFVADSLKTLKASDLTTFQSLLSNQAKINYCPANADRIANFASWVSYASQGYDKIQIGTTKKLSDETTAVLITGYVPDSDFLLMNFQVTCPSPDANATSANETSCKISQIYWEILTCPGLCDQYEIDRAEDLMLNLPG